MLYFGGGLGLLLLAAGLYLSVANAVWTRTGTTRLSGAAARIASGDLSFRVSAPLRRCRGARGRRPTSGP